LFSGPVDDALAARGLKRRVALSVPGFLTLLDVLQTDDLIATVPRRFLEGRSGDVRRVKPPIEVQGFDVIAAWHGRLNHDPAHRWVRDLLV
jgi:DNA-binding transcriptional LysR family regulator